MAHSQKRAFTLIELMIAMAIIGVLVAMILPRFKGMRDQSSISKAQSELRGIKAAMESYFIRQNGYPDNSTTVCATYLTLASTYPRILQNALYDPFGATSTTEYVYSKSPNGLYYVVYSVGPNGAAGITGINNSGSVTGTPGDDIYTSNS